MASAYVKGLQGGALTSPSPSPSPSGDADADVTYLLTAATAKHFLGYQGASTRELRSPTEIYLSWRDQAIAFFFLPFFVCVRSLAPPHHLFDFLL